MNKFSFYFKYLLTSLGILVTIFFFIDRLLYQSALDFTISRQQQKLILKTAYISNYFEPMLKDIELLANQTGLQYYLNSKKNKADLIRDYNLFAEVNKSYTQVRIIDENGIESIRVNYAADSVDVVPEDLLQDKKDRDYFIESSKYNKDQIYVSNIELNQEQGAIETPYRPVLRVSKPLFDNKGNRKGIIITNYDASIFLQKISTYYQEEEELFFLDEQGYFISAPEEYPLWGFMIPSIESKDFNYFFPEVWSRIHSNQIGHHLSKKGLFVYENISLSNFDFSSINPNSIVTPNNWVILTWIPQNELNQVLYSHRKNLFAGLFFLIIIITIGFYFLGKSRLALIKKDLELTSANENLRLKQEELIQKNEELEQFVYITSHDLQEPLRTVSSYTEILKEDYLDKLDEDGIRFLGYLSSSSERLLDLVRGILDYSRINKHRQKESVDLQELVQDILKDLHYTITNTNANINVGALPTIFGYKSKLRMLFQNLISNALKFTENGVSPNIEISVQEEHEVYIFYILDHGIGINDKHQSKIFNMFQRLHRHSEYEGNGIGLALCKKIVELHGGTISLTSKLGKGSTFKFSIVKKQ